MAWTNPKTWNVREKLTAALLNAHIRDNLAYLKGIVDGTGTDKIPGSALINNITIPGATLSADLRVPELPNGALVFGGAVPAQSRIFAAYNRIHVTANGYIDSNGAWQAFDTTLPAYIMRFGDPNVGTGVYYRAPGGANTWALIWALPNSARQGGVGFYDSGNALLSASSTASFVHGLGQQPRFVGGYSDYGYPSGDVSRPLLGDSTANDPYVSKVDQSYIQVTTTSVSGATVRVFAML